MKPPPPRCYLIALVVALFGVSCGAPRGDKTTAPATQAAPTSAIPQEDWLGVFASTSEIGGFSGTVLVLQKGLRDEIDYRLRFYTDVISAHSIEQEVRTGSCLVEGRTLYLPQAYGYMRDGKPRLLASIARYTMVEVNGRKTLMRDDALRAFRQENKLYDYGILIKVSDDAHSSLDLRTGEHPSIKVLYSDPAKPWNDPFIHGPNNR